jgi:hypothetical protein
MLTCTAGVLDMFSRPRIFRLSVLDEGMWGRVLSTKVERKS